MATVTELVTELVLELLDVDHEFDNDLERENDEKVLLILLDALFEDLVFTNLVT